MADGSTEYSHLTVNFKLQNGSEITTAYTGDFEAQKAYPAVTIAIPRFPTYSGYMPSLPVKPTAEGLIFDFSAADYKFTYSFDGTQKAGDIVVDIVFVPILQVYKAEYYHQSLVDNTQFEKVATETFSGMTGSAVDPEAIVNRHSAVAAGFTMRDFNAMTIAADGSTVVKVFYDRNYYLLSFDTAGAVESTASQYLPFDAEIGTVSTPRKPGYTFAGWSPAVPSNMPAANTICTAQWTLTAPNANVSIVVWGENANDANYAYLTTSIVSAPVDSTYTIDPSTLTIYACGKQEHKHTDECLNCSHVHDVTCYGATSTTQQTVNSTYVSNFTNLEGSLASGSIYRRSSDYWLYYDGKWYKSSSDNVSGNYRVRQRFSGTYHYVYNAKNTCSHIHTAACYSCGMTEHTHSDDCKLNTSLYNINTGKTETSVVVKADGTSVLNVFYDRNTFTITMKYASTSQEPSQESAYTKTSTITAKWDENISSRWSDITQLAKNAKWSRSVRGGSPYTGLLQIMPKENRTYYMAQTGGNTYTGSYYIECLDQTATGANIITYEGVKYELLAAVPIQKTSSVTMTDEDKIDIDGFAYYHGYTNRGNWGGAQLKYKRNSYNLVLNNGKENVSTESLKFEMPLNTASSLSTAPSLPDTIPSAYLFDGWSLSPDGGSAPLDLSTITMPASSLILYARWKAPECNVLAYTSDAESSSYFQGVTIYGNKIYGLATPTKENHEFLGWFYTDDTGAARAFDPDTMYVTEDMHLHAKWRNLATAEYTIYFIEIEEDSAKTLADPQTGTATVDTSFIVTPKQISGYFPTVADKSITMTEGGDNSATFEYIKVSNVPYMVKYVDAATGTEIFTAKTVDVNPLDVVTEKYVHVDNYIVREAYKTRYMVVSNNTPQPAENVIVFEYDYNPNDILVTVEYYVNTDLNGTVEGMEKYRLDSYTQKQMKYEAGQTVEITPLTIENFSLNTEISSPTTQAMPSPKADMAFLLYYDPVTVTVTYYDGVNQGVLQRNKVLPGSGTPAYVSATPSHPEEPDNYVFNGWDKEIAATVNEDTDYYAQWAGVFHVHHCTGDKPNAEKDVKEKIRLDAVGENIFDITAPLVPAGGKALYNGISSGCLYGGLWSDATGSALREDVCGVELQPKTGDHYYVREISDGYLTPRTLTVRIKGVYSCALVSAIDDPANYIGFGFDAEAVSWTSTTAFEKLVVKYADPKKADSEYTADDVFKGLSGKMICNDAPEGEGEQKLSFTPFYATKDSVKVFGKKTRSLAYSSSASSTVADSDSGLPCVKYAAKMGDYAADDDDETMRLSMILAPSFVLGGGDEGTSVNVTINIGDLCTTVPVPSGADLSDGVTNPSVEGCVFAGWFRDEACTRPASLSCVAEDMEIYAGFLGGGYLKVAELPAANGSDAVRVRLVSAVDTVLASECGFVVTDVNGTREIQASDFYGSVDGYTAEELFGDTDGFASLMCLDLVLAGVEGEGGVTVTPYWKPLCGARVLGEAKRVMVNGK
ncbi:MAG: InlB B-repeat-containing protein [Lentisphaeria bacterium]|nr:InlB B-repeat-containing protein [Lentisphaeria bacterium]